MNSLLENPIGIGIFGLVLVGLLFFTAIQLGERKVVYGAVAVLALTAALVGISIAIETDDEKIRKSILELATALRTNNHERALEFMHPNAVPTMQRAKADLASVKFEEAKVTSIRSVSINDTLRPPTAIIEFIGYIKASSDRYTGGYPAGAPRYFKLYWMKQNDQWLIRDYEHSDVREALAN